MKTALITVFDKTNLESIAQFLVDQEYTIYATSGTQKYLKKYGIDSQPVVKITQNPSGFEDCLQALSFNTIVGAVDFDDKRLCRYGILKIDILICNFTFNAQNLSEFDIRSVDFGGPALAQAAAINYKKTLVISSPEQYSSLITKISTGNIPIEIKRNQAYKTLLEINHYNDKLADYLKITYSQIKKVCQEDLKALINVRDKSWLATYPNANLNISSNDIEAALKIRSFNLLNGEKMIARKNEFWFCARHLDKIIGYMRVILNDESYEISEFYILPEFCNQGIGTEMLSLIFKKYLPKRPINLSVAKYTQALKFYQKNGFEIVGCEETTAGSLPNGKIIPELKIKLTY